MRRLLPLTLLLLQSLSASAAAHTLYASPTGGGNCSTPQQACTLPQAINAASAATNDEVVAVAGTYAINAPGDHVSLHKAIRVHGPTGHPRALLTGSSNAGALVTMSDGAVLSDFDIIRTGSEEFVLSLQGATAERLYVSSSSGVPAVALGGGALLRDSVAHSSGAGAVNLYAGTADLRNVTAITTANAAPALYVSQVCAGPCMNGNAIVRNSILHSANGPDIRLQNMMNMAPFPRVEVGHSIYKDVLSDSGGVLDTSPGGNLSGPAIFSDDRFHSSAESMAFEAGTAEATLLGSTDLDGNARVLGSRPDIGADEVPVPAPLVNTGDAGGIGESTATVSGSFKAWSGQGTWRFEYGPTANLGSVTPASTLDSGNAMVDVTAALASLTPGTTYHYRLVVTGQGGTAAGPIKSFTTLKSSVVAPVVTSDTTAPTLALALLKRLRVRVVLSEASVVDFVLYRERRVRGKRKLRRLRSFSRPVAAGSSTISLRRYKLRKGTYVLKGRARDASGNRSKTTRLRFRVKRR